MSKKLKIELKYRVENPLDLFKKLEGVKPEVFYIKDFIYGEKGTPYKIRKRVAYQNGLKTELTSTLTLQGAISKVIEEEVEKIPKDFTCENSYEKIRFSFDRYNCEIILDFTPIGIFSKIIGNEKLIRKVAKLLKLKVKNAIHINTDAYYRDMHKNALDHWGFGKI